jgi:curved DNA-binding protein
MSQQDYYEMLEVSSEASPAEIKRAYRRLALQTHPDRNRNDPRAEERFKKISEAYGVLSDPAKRAQYDHYRKLGYRQSGAGQGYHQTGFGYSQEEILRDLFSGSHARDVFSEMQKEFQRMGFRFDEKFINNLFFGGKTIFFQGVIWGGGKGTRSFRSSDFTRAGERAPYKNQPMPDATQPKGLLQAGVAFLGKTGRKIGGYLLNKALGLDGHSGLPFGKSEMSGHADVDVTFNVAINASQAARGGTLEVELPHLEGGKKITVRIPAGVRAGTRLRLKSMGKHFPDRTDERGDVYLNLQVI